MKLVYKCVGYHPWLLACLRSISQHQFQFVSFIAVLKLTDTATFNDILAVCMDMFICLPVADAIANSRSNFLL